MYALESHIYNNKDLNEYTRFAREIKQDFQTLKICF